MIDAVAVIAAIGTLLGAITGAGVRRVWVWGWVYEAEVRRADFWQDAFLRATEAKGETIQHIETKVVGG